MEFFEELIAIQSDEQIIEFAIENEIESMRFFTACANHVDDPLVAKLFRIIAEKELQNKETLEFELMKIGCVVKNGMGDDFFDFAKYLRQINFPRNATCQKAGKIAMAKQDSLFRLYMTMAKKPQSEKLNETFVFLAEETIRQKIWLETQLYLS
jgi:hypothetical protein